MADPFGFSTFTIVSSTFHGSFSSFLPIFLLLQWLGPLRQCDYKWSWWTWPFSPQIQGKKNVYSFTTKYNFSCRIFYRYSLLGWESFILLLFCWIFKNHECALNFSKCFLMYLLIVLICLITLITYQIVNQPCISGINPTWSQYVFFLFWIWLVNILFGIFVSMFIRILA